MTTDDKERAMEPDKVRKIRERTHNAEQVCVEDGCTDPAHYGPRKDIRTLLATIDRLRSERRELIAGLRNAGEAIGQITCVSGEDWRNHSHQLCHEIANALNDHLAALLAKYDKEGRR